MGAVLEESWTVAAGTSESSLFQELGSSAEPPTRAIPTSLISAPRGWVPNNCTQNAAATTTLSERAFATLNQAVQQQTQLGSTNLDVIPSTNQLLDPADGGTKLVADENCGGGGAAAASVERSASEADEFERYEHLASANEKLSNRVFSHGHWSTTECRILFEAKKRDKEMCSGLKKNSISYVDRWKAVAEYCWSKGVQRSKDQCKFKWENTIPEFKRIKAYEDERIPEAKSYFDMDKFERKSLQLPRNMEQEFYSIMDSVLDVKSGGDRKTPKKAADAQLGDLAGIEVDAGVADNDVEGSVAPNRSEKTDSRNDHKDHPDDHSPVKKRKRRSSKQQSSEQSYKKETISSAEALRSNLIPGGGGDAHRGSDVHRHEGAVLIAEERSTGMELIRVESASKAGGGGGGGCGGGGGGGGGGGMYSRFFDSCSPSNLHRRKWEESHADTPPPPSQQQQEQQRRETERQAAEDTRHRELIAVEKEKVHAISSVASALNNVASAFLRMAELIQQRTQL